MDYKQAVQFHEDTKKYGSILGLGSIRVLMRELGDVWKRLKIVHIAGTNGKGSVSCFLASVLKEAGFLVGQFNSPAVFDLREIYRVGGQWIGKEEYASCMETVADACEKMTKKGFSHPTIFEVETALAFLWFFRRKCEVVLLEAGMGGETDATNLIRRPLCSVVTSIGMDHMEFLGDSVEKIAELKAGIIKENCPVVTIHQPPEAGRMLQQKAKERHAAYHIALDVTESRIFGGRLCFFYPGLGEVKLSMTGSYQAQNAALAIKTLEVLKDLGYFITKTQILKGLEAAEWSGRFECLSNAPLFYIDGAHNAEAAEELKVSLLKNFPGYKKIGIMGVMADKPYREMIEILKMEFDMVYTVTPDHPRAFAAEKLAEEWQSKGICAAAEQSVSDAVKAAYETAADNSETMMAIAFGSLYYLKEVKNALHEITGD